MFEQRRLIAGKKEIAGQSLPHENEVFESYINDFDINESDLRDKTILDIGSGSNPLFANYLLQHNLTDMVYALDYASFSHDHNLTFYRDEDVKRLVKYYYRLAEPPGKKRYVQGNSVKLPFKANSFDLILMRAAAFPRTDYTQLLRNVIWALKPGGKFEMYPVFREEADLRGFRSHNGRLKICQALAELNPKNVGFEWIEKDKYQEKGKVYPKDLFILRKLTTEKS